VPPRKVLACGPATTEIRIPGNPPRRCRLRPIPYSWSKRRCRVTAPWPSRACRVLPGAPWRFIGYEYVNRIEPSVPPAAVDELKLPLLYFMFSDSILIFDRAKQTLRLCVNAHVRGEQRRRLRRRRPRLNELFNLTPQATRARAGSPDRTGQADRASRQLHPGALRASRRGRKGVHSLG